MAGAAQPQQESVYVVVELQDCDAMPPPGSRLQLEGMETAQPVLQLADGTRLVGAVEETVGTQLVLSDTLAADGSHRVELVAHTDKRICFARPPAEQSDSDGEQAGTG